MITQFFFPFIRCYFRFQNILSFMDCLVSLTQFSLSWDVLSSKEEVYNISTIWNNNSLQMKPWSCFLSLRRILCVDKCVCCTCGENWSFPFWLGEGVPRDLEMCPGALRTCQLTGQGTAFFIIHCGGIYIRAQGGCKEGGTGALHQWKARHSQKKWAVSFLLVSLLFPAAWE